MRPLVSVVIPTFNSGWLLCEALESVFAQTMSDYEVIVVDDGSTDDTPRLVLAYGDRIRYYRQQSKGSSKARSMGVSLSVGEYIAALDADDIWLPTKLEQQIEAMRRNPSAGLCYTDGYRWLTEQPLELAPSLGDIYGGGRSGWQFCYMFKRPAAATSSMLFRRDAYEAVGGYDVELQYCDAEFLIRMAAYYPLVFVPALLMAYRVHSNNTSSTVHKGNAAMNLEFMRLIRVKVSARVPSHLGDFSIQLYRRFPGVVQWALLLYWRFTCGSVLFTCRRICQYTRALMLGNRVR